ncbi:MAG: tRNA (adenosine(37)-N6)-dimethylallyltransferase MiaA [Verrucomicrobiota bacterium]|nr:tRNA (adenosine(37)-N6)-dimethylallyltransferase MiaA [Verrucomicrobiota bacterium]
MTSISLPVFLAGPTAVGKSAVALLLAEKINGEIISVDSMQVYRGLNLGTAKPSPQERAKIPHHLIDVVDLNESFDAAQFCRLAQNAVVEIQARNRIPIFCGGTGFYFKAFLEGLGEAPPSNETIRVELKKKTLAELLEELKQLDPITFEKIDRQNPRRIVRALEVIHLTGKPFSEQRADWRRSETGERKSGGKNRNSGIFFGLAREMEDLRQRINLRVEKMFQRGLVAETEELLKRGLEKNKTAMQAIGYRQVVTHLRGERSLSETKELVKIKTRQFAKRQMTWFRRQAKLSWINIDQKENESCVADRLFKEITTKI